MGKKIDVEDDYGGKRRQRLRSRSDISFYVTI